MEKINVMFVEDELIVAEDLKSILKEEGYNVIGYFSSGEELLDKIDNNIPDILLMDIMLKGKLNGIETVEKIREKYSIPVIYITSYADDITLQKAQVTQPYGYILKPFGRREIHTNIQIAVYKHKMETSIKQNEFWYQSVIKSIGDAVIVTDKRGYIKFENKQSEELTGFYPEEIKGKNISEIFKILNDNSKKCIEGSKSLSNDLVLIDKTGSKIPVYENATPIRDKKGDITGIVMTFHKI